MLKGSKKIFGVLAIAVATTLLSGCGGDKKADVAGTKDGKQGQPAVTVSLCHPGVTTHSWQKACEFMQKELQNSGTNITLDIYPNNQIASGAKLVEMVQMGTLDCAAATNMTMSGFISEMDGLSLPMLFDTREKCFYAMDNEVGKYLDELCQKKGLKILCWWENGVRDITNNTRPIVKPEDMKGLSIRIPESKIFQKTFEALGALPTAMPSSEIYTSLQTGVVSGQENAADYIRDQKYYEVQKYYTESNLTSSIMGVFIGLEKFNSLTPEQQKALLDAAHKSAVYQRTLSAQDLKKAREDIATHGIKMDKLQDLDAWRKAVQPVYDEYKDTYGEIVKLVKASTDNFKASGKK